MDKIECNRCGETKAATDMITRGGKPARLCKQCFGASFRKGSKKTRRVKSLEEVVEKRVRQPKPVQLNGHLEVEQAYRRLAMQHHPDRGGDADAMSRLNAARDAMLERAAA